VSVSDGHPDDSTFVSELRTFLSNKVVWDGAVLLFSRYGQLLELKLQIDPCVEEKEECGSVSLSDSFANISLSASRRDLVTSTPCKTGTGREERLFCMLGENTLLTLNPKENTKSVVATARPLGGLQAPFKLVSDAVQSILEHTAAGKRQPVNGILLFGPPGTGKSLLAETVCRRFPSVQSQVVAGPELYSKYLGETEAQLRQVFATAVRSAPAILVLEDLDCLAPRREGAGGGSELERRLAVTLQTLLDRLGRDQSRNKERLFTVILNISVTVDCVLLFEYSDIFQLLPVHIAFKHYRYAVLWNRNNFFRDKKILLKKFEKSNLHFFSQRYILYYLLCLVHNFVRPRVFRIFICRIRYR
jgi:hypothetical protein